ncbi:MAG: chemotaxis protein CheX [Bdellovibrionaceae bacterium]|nr:chemotaxis protein CheX [Pseudobdellovibrionaceae bacterium]
MSGTAESKPAIDVDLINQFLTATKTVLQTQANVSITPGKPYLKKAGETIPMQIAGVIALTNPAFTGTIALCLRDEVFLNIYENMVGEKHEKITAELEDAAGELLNMIFGQVKTILNDQKGYKLEKALPTVLTGEKLTLRHRGATPAIILPFDSSSGVFHIEVFIQQDK